LRWLQIDRFAGGHFGNDDTRTIDTWGGSLRGFFLSWCSSLEHMSQQQQQQHTARPPVSFAWPFGLESNKLRAKLCQLVERKFEHVLILAALPVLVGIAFAYCIASVVLSVKTNQPAPKDLTVDPAFAFLYLLIKVSVDVLLALAVGVILMAMYDWMWAEKRLLRSLIAGVVEHHIDSVLQSCGGKTLGWRGFKKLTKKETSRPTVTEIQMPAYFAGLIFDDEGIRSLIHPFIPHDADTTRFYYYLAIKRSAEKRDQILELTVLVPNGDDRASDLKPAVVQEGSSARTEVTTQVCNQEEQQPMTPIMRALLPFTWRRELAIELTKAARERSVTYQVYALVEPPSNDPKKQTIGIECMAGMMRIFDGNTKYRHMQMDFVIQSCAVPLSGAYGGVAREVLAADFVKHLHHEYPSGTEVLIDTAILQGNKITVTVLIRGDSIKC
jgi:hypothetical protein